MTLLSVSLILALGLTIAASQGLSSCITNYNPNTNQVLSGPQYIGNPSFEGGRTPWFAQDSESWDRIYAQDVIYGSCGKWVAKIIKDKSRSACMRPSAAVWQIAVVNQTTAKSLLVSGWAFGVDVSGTSHPSDYSIYADLTYQDGSHSYMVYAPFDTTIDRQWQFASVVINPDRPLYSVNVYGLFRATTVGTVYFDNFSLRTVTIKNTPTTAPTTAPTNPTNAPTTAPTNPTNAPTNPTNAPTNPTSAPTSAPTGLRITETQYYNPDCTGTVTYQETFGNGECNTNLVLDTGSSGSLRWTLNGNIVSQCSYYLNTSGCSQDTPAINPCSDHRLNQCLYGKVFSIASNSNGDSCGNVAINLVKGAQSLESGVYHTAYTIQIQNQGTCTLSNLRISITVPSGSTFTPTKGLTYYQNSYYVDGANLLGAGQPFFDTTLMVDGGNALPTIQQISVACNC